MFLLLWGFLQSGVVTFRIFCSRGSYVKGFQYPEVPRSKDSRVHVTFRDLQVSNIQGSYI